MSERDERASRPVGGLRGRAPLGGVGRPAAQVVEDAPQQPIVNQRDHAYWASNPEVHLRAIDHRAGDYVVVHFLQGHERAGISVDLARRIEAWLGPENGGAAETWLRMQIDYDLWQSNRTRPLGKVKRAVFEAA